MAFGRESWSHLAAGAAGAGLGGGACRPTRWRPEARIGAITREIALALGAIGGMVAGPMVVTGHSAGGHLSARMACRDVGAAARDRQRLVRAVPISPLADLAPLLARPR